MIIPFIKNINFFELAKFMKIAKSSTNSKPLYKLPNNSDLLPLSTITSINIPSIGKSTEPFTAGCLRDSTQEQIYNVSDHIALCYMGYIKHSISALEEWSAVIHLSGFTIPLQGTPDRGCDLVNSDDFHFHLYYYSYFNSYMEVVLQDGVQSPTIADNEFTRQHCALNGDRIRINVDRTWMQNNGIGRIFKIGVKNNTVYFYIDDTLIGYQAKTLSIDSINVGEFPQRLQYFDLQYHAYVYDIQDFLIYDKFIFDIPAYGYLSGNPPFIFNSNGNPLVSWSISGNTEQSGTPTPENPVIPQGTGERTENLLHEFYAASGKISGNSYTITKNSIETHNDGSILGVWYVLAEFKRYGNYANYTPIDEKHSFKIPAGTYTFSANENIHSNDNGLRLIVGQLSQTVAGATGGAKNIGVGQTFTVDADSYVCPVLEIRYDSRVDEYILANPMLNTGSSALPYQPYGYKLDIKSANTTTPVYLGAVETTRKIRKFVLDGTETVVGSAVTGGWIITSLPVSINNTTGLQTSYCSHYVAKNNGAMSNLSQGEMCISTQYNNRINFVTTFATAEDFKSYLAAQYAAGTPVTIWYVLATEETGIVNEPLMKIGDYADTVSKAQAGVEIPTTNGSNTLSVDTTIQPSEVSIVYENKIP